jgi:ABC-type antimicrobial peptide transport system permease subunit
VIAYLSLLLLVREQYESDLMFVKEWPTDPLVLALSTLLLALVASEASLLPANRAARINPLAAIRPE